MLKLSCDLFQYIADSRATSQPVDALLLPMSPFRKKDGTYVMGAGTLRRVSERFPWLPSALASSSYAVAGSLGMHKVVDGVHVYPWFIQPERCTYECVQPHLRERMADYEGLDAPDVPGWAARPVMWLVECTIPAIQALRHTHIVAPYPNVGELAENFRELMERCDDRVVLLTQGGVNAPR